MCILTWVINMNNQDFLSTLLKTTQTSQVQIRRILDNAMDPSLRSSLKKHLLEYDAAETEALSIALQRGWDLKHLDPVFRFLVDFIIRCQLKGRRSDSKIAEVMIRRNTSAMIHGLRNLHKYTDKDHRIRILAQKILDCETANIRQLQGYL